MKKLSKVEGIKNLKVDEDGLHFEFEIYKDECDAASEFSLNISHDGSSGCTYNHLVTSADIARIIDEYIEFNM